MIDTVVVLCRYVPDPTRSSGELRFWQILKHLGRRCRRVLLLSEVPGDAARFPGLELRPMNELEESARSADLALLEFWYMDVHLPTLREVGLPVIIDSVDIEFLRREREKAVLGIEGNYYHLEKAREVEAYREAAQVWVVSAADADHIPGIARDLAVVPNILDPEAASLDFADRDGVCFVGSYRHFPNVDALRWYRKEIRPRLRGVPHTIVGYDAPSDIRRMRGFIGGVPNSRASVGRARVSIAPLRYGAGLKGKVLEAMACGTPVVTTPIGAEGYDKGAVTVAESPAEFAAATRRLLTDRGAWEAAAQRGREVAERFSPAAVGTQIDDALSRAFVEPERAAS